MTAPTDSVLRRHHEQMQAGCRVERPGGFRSGWQSRAIAAAAASDVPTDSVLRRHHEQMLQAARLVPTDSVLRRHHEQVQQAARASVGTAGAPEPEEAAPPPLPSRRPPAVPQRHRSLLPAVPQRRRNRLPPVRAGASSAGSRGCSAAEPALGTPRRSRPMPASGPGDGPDTRSGLGRFSGSADQPLRRVRPARLAVGPQHGSERRRPEDREWSRPGRTWCRRSSGPRACRAAPR